MLGDKCEQVAVLQELPRSESVEHGLSAAPHLEVDTQKCMNLQNRDRLQNVVGQLSRRRRMSRITPHSPGRRHFESGATLRATKSPAVKLRRGESLLEFGEGKGSEAEAG